MPSAKHSLRQTRQGIAAALSPLALAIGAALTWWYWQAAPQRNVLDFRPLRINGRASDRMAPARAIASVFPSGIPLVQDMVALRETEVFRQIKAYSDAFVKEHNSTLTKYSWHIPDPFMTWSRQYEYTYVYASVVEYARRSLASPTLLDIGSGVTFFDYLLADTIPGSYVIALDNDDSYPALFKELNTLRADRSSVQFDLHDARQDVQFPDNSFDVVVCVSVLEHTDDYEKIVTSVHRLLRPGGAFILTFDIATSPTGGIGLQSAKAADLLQVLSKYFSEIGGPPHAYTEGGIADRIQGSSGQIMDVTWINANLPEIAGQPGWAITVSCHTFFKW